MSEQVPTKDLLTRLRTGYLCEVEGCRCHAIEARSGCQCAEAADEIEELRKALKRAVSQCGHVYNCSAARGSERDCTCGWTAAKELARKLP